MVYAQDNGSRCLISEIKILEKAIGKKFKDPSIITTAQTQLQKHLLGHTPILWHCFDPRCFGDLQR